MSTSGTTSLLPTARPSLDNLPRAAAFVVALIAYCAFAAAVYFAHGSEPTLNIDHLSYLKLANEIRADNPDGNYWRHFNVVRFYGVIMAYAYDVTGSHITTLKLLLAVETVAYLLSFQLFMGLATRSRLRAILFALLSAFFVSFGASMWGMTDFSASLNRSIIIPFVVLLAWFFFRFFASPWRYAIYPALVALSLLHLGAMHVILVFGLFELLDFLLRRRCRFDLNLVWFGLAMLAAVGVQMAIEVSGVGAGDYVRQSIAMATKAPTPASAAAKPPGTVPGPRKPTTTPTTLEPARAWEIELIAFPWRNFPPSLATLATILSSFGVILCLAIAGAARAYRLRSEIPADRPLATFALAVPIAAFGLQAVVWVLRKYSSILPINFEEIRSINMIMLPALYFVCRLYELVPDGRRIPATALRAAIVVAVVLQPILVLRMLPATWREGIVEAAIDRGVIKRNDSLRMLYARQFLGLGSEGRRFYYSSKPAIDWLKQHAGPNDRVLTNVDEFHGSGLKTVGPFLGVMDISVWELRRATWAEMVEAVNAALASRDLDRVRQLARSLGATYAVVDWPVEGAAYSDEYYSVVRVTAQPR